MEFVMGYLSNHAKQTLHCVSRKFEGDSHSLQRRLLDMTQTATLLNIRSELFDPSRGRYVIETYVRRKRGYTLPGFPSHPMDYAMEYLARRSRKALRRVSRIFAKDPRSLQERLLTMTLTVNEIKALRSRGDKLYRAHRGY